MDFRTLYEELRMFEFFAKEQCKSKKEVESCKGVRYLKEEIRSRHRQAMKEQECTKKRRYNQDGTYVELIKFENKTLEQVEDIFERLYCRELPDQLGCTGKFYSAVASFFEVPNGVFMYHVVDLDV